MFRKSKNLHFLAKRYFVNLPKTSKPAILDENWTLSYENLDKNSSIVADAIKAKLGENRKQISLLCPNNSSYATAKFAIWKSQNVSVPLCKSHPAKTMEYYIKDSKSDLIIASSDLIDKAFKVSKACNVELMLLEDLDFTNNASNFNIPNYEDSNDAMIVYTSGTTGPPKGVLSTFGNIKASVNGMIESWGWSKNDKILHCLPLHHVHGIINCLLTPLAIGASIKMLENFDSKQVWQLFMDEGEKLNVFMAVPTIYAKLIEEYSKQFENSHERENVKDFLQNNFRLMVSGSAALPQPILEKWREISGHTLLERYGMTEIGMALTNPLQSQKNRRPGWVGRPFPGVKARVVHEGKVVAEATNCHFEGEAFSGDLQIFGPNVFKEYFGKIEATKKEFTNDGWFKTGDTAKMDPKTGEFKILGRSSVDIIKSAGYKISALDVERILLEHPVISEVAVMGVEDESYGQIVVAIVVPKEKQPFSLEILNSWAKDKMPKYQIPKKLKLMNELPKNQMGKVNKKELVKVF